MIIIIKNSLIKCFYNLNSKFNVRLFIKNIHYRKLALIAIVMVITEVTHEINAAAAATTTTTAPAPAPAPKAGYTNINDAMKALLSKS